MTFAFFATSTGIFSTASSVMTEASGSTYAMFRTSAQYRHASSFDKYRSSIIACTSIGVSPCLSARLFTSFSYSKCGSLNTRSRKGLFFRFSTGGLGFEDFSDFLLVKLLHGERRRRALRLQFLQDLGQRVFHF